jgi:hypothetical protein
MIALSAQSLIARAIPVLNPGGHDFVTTSMDLLGVCYIILACVWTIFTAWGIALLVLWRDHEVIRMRGISTPIAAIVMLHIYSICVFSVYPSNGSFTCGFEFWIMSIALPFGMGLFQGES